MIKVMLSWFHIFLTKTLFDDYPILYQVFYLLLTTITLIWMESRNGWFQSKFIVECWFFIFRQCYQFILYIYCLSHYLCVIVSCWETKRNFVLYVKLHSSHTILRSEVCSILLSIDSRLNWIDPSTNTPPPPNP